ncbi:MAG: hypothetical protein CTY15_01095 [Methylocystis sp.]|nr:MAG: hypothetical protein CTY15_01095 [Methylocystis sp.]
MTPRSLAALAAAALFAFGLSGCGRRGPLELPPDVQARGAAIKAQQETQAKTVARNAPKAAPGEAEPEAAPTRIPGTIGNRPPEQYPFVLDPLLQ